MLKMCGTIVEKKQGMPASLKLSPAIKRWDLSTAFAPDVDSDRTQEPCVPPQILNVNRSSTPPQFARALSR